MRKKREPGNGAMEADGQLGRIGAQMSPMAKLVKIVYDYCQVTVVGMIIPVDMSVSPYANCRLT